MSRLGPRHTLVGVLLQKPEQNDRQGGKRRLAAPCRLEVPLIVAETTRRRQDSPPTARFRGQGNTFPGAPRSLHPSSHMRDGRDAVLDEVTLPSAGGGTRSADATLPSALPSANAQLKTSHRQASRATEQTGMVGKLEGERF